MPIVRVYGIPEISQEYLLSVCEKIKEELSRIMEIEQKDIFVFFPTDKLIAGLGEEIIMFVDDLSDTKEINNMQKRDLAKFLAIKINQDFPDAFVKIIIRPFMLEQISYSIPRGKYS